MRNAAWGWSRLCDNKRVRLFLIATLVITIGVVIGRFSVAREVPIKLLLVGIAALLTQPS